MSALMTREIARRAVALAMLSAGLALIPSVGPVFWGGLIAASALFYIGLPKARRPQAALVYERGPAVIGPDLLGFLLCAFFIALPFWARGSDAGLWEDFGVLVHPAALMTWPLALVSAAILWFSAQHAAMWLVIQRDGLRINRLRGTRFVPFSEIAEVGPYRRGLPGWMRRVAPSLAAAGHAGAAGAILLARDTRGIVLTLQDGSRIAIPTDAFEKPLARVLAALKRNKVRFAPA